MGDIKRFADLNPAFDDVEEWVKIDDLLDKEIMVEDFVTAEGEYGEYAIIKFTLPEDFIPRAFTTGAKVILKKVKMAKEKDVLPLPGKIVKKKRYYDII